MVRRKLFYQSFKLFLLAGCELITDLLVCVLSHGLNRLSHLSLTVSDDFFDGCALLRRELQFVIQLLDKLLAQNFRHVRRLWLACAVGLDD
jgi:hypothetical protein